MATDRITFKCAKCGGASFVYPRQPKANDMVTCNRCGATGRYADIQTKAIKEAKRVTEKLLADAIKKVGRK